MWFVTGTRVLDVSKIFYRFCCTENCHCQQFLVLKDVKFLDIRKIVEQGMLHYIYPKKNNILNGESSWKEMYFKFLIDVIKWLQEYYQRVHAESFHSSFKRVFGIIIKVRGHSKFIQIMARIILHNRARLSYFKRIKR